MAKEGMSETEGEFMDLYANEDGNTGRCWITSKPLLYSVRSPSGGIRKKR